jgi:hypothetical protein
VRLATLANKFRGQTVTIVGTGPSMRVVPREWLHSAATLESPLLLLNQAWRYFAGKRLTHAYGLTVHPELVLEHHGETVRDTYERQKVRWVVKQKPPLQTLTLDDPQYYVFHTTKEWSAITARPADTLFLGHGVHLTALDLAARMGARAIALLGVDMGSLGGAHHGHAQHVRFHGNAPAESYRLYRAYARKARTVLRTKLGVPVLTLSPLLGLADPAEDYEALTAELGLEPLPPPVDTSPYETRIPEP